MPHNKTLIKVACDNIILMHAVLKTESPKHRWMRVPSSIFSDKVIHINNQFLKSQRRCSLEVLSIKYCLQSMKNNCVFPTTHT